MTGAAVILVIVAVAVALRRLARRLRREDETAEALSSLAVEARLRPRGGHVEASPQRAPLAGLQTPAPTNGNGRRV